LKATKKSAAKQKKAAPRKRDLSLVPKPVPPAPNKPAKESDRIERDENGKLRIPAKSFENMAKAFAHSPNEKGGHGETVAVLLSQLAATMPFGRGDANDPTALNFAIDSLLELAPRDCFESLICSQMVALHSLGMEYLKRSIAPGSTSEQVDANVNRATRLLRTFGSLAEQFRARRGGGRQKIVVKHVNVNAGGQAIVGNVGRGVGGE
jgi:hypothetical protein